MKQQITKISVATILMVLVGSVSQASECSLKKDSIADTMELGAFVKEEMQAAKTGMRKVSLGSFQEGRTYKIDRNDARFPFFQTLNGGITTSTENIDMARVKAGTQGFAQAIPLTRCHWITNLHVAKGLANEQGVALDKVRAFAGFGRGSSCEGKEQFKASGSGRLVGYNKAAIKADGRIADDKDWAIFASDKMISGLPQTRISTSDVEIGYAALMVGNSKDGLSDDGFNALDARVVRGESGVAAGLIQLEGNVSMPGQSGAGVYRIEKDQLALAAINVGGGGVLNISEILKQLRESNPELAKDIMRVYRDANAQCK